MRALRSNFISKRKRNVSKFKSTSNSGILRMRACVCVQTPVIRPVRGLKYVNIQAIINNYSKISREVTVIV